MQEYVNQVTNIKPLSFEPLEENYYNNFPCWFFKLTDDIYFQIGFNVIYEICNVISNLSACILHRDELS